MQYIHMDNAPRVLVNVCKVSQIAIQHAAQVLFNMYEAYWGY